MYIRRPERKHWGNYKITARNCVGSKNVTTAINILDIPSPPLHVRPATVTKDFIAIAWNKPQDNGGSLVTEYIVEKRDMSMFAWLPCGKTEKLSMEVNSVLETQTYMFRVAAVNGQGRSKWADSQTVTCQDPLHPPGASRCRSSDRWTAADGRPPCLLQRRREWRGRGRTAHVAAAGSDGEASAWW